MILKEKVEEAMWQFRNDMGTKEDLVKNEEGIIKEIGSVENLIDTAAEGFRIYIAELRNYKEVK